MSLEQLVKYAINGYSGGVALAVLGAYLLTQTAYPNTVLGFIVLFIGIGIVVWQTWTDREFKKKRHDAPWLFDRYKGE